jgi:hypothetical protein
MNQLPDRKKLRQEYLKQKAGAYAKGTAGATLVIPATLLCCLLGGITVALMIVMLYTATPVNLIFVLLTATLTTISGALVRWCWRARHEFRRAADIPYVPPVNANALPADEVLVRSSEEPAVAQSEVLLRAAQRGQETAKEELLRVSAGE